MFLWAQVKTKNHDSGDMARHSWPWCVDWIHGTWEQHSGRDSGTGSMAAAGGLSRERRQISRERRAWEARGQQTRGDPGEFINWLFFFKESFWVFITSIELLVNFEVFRLNVILFYWVFILSEISLRFIGKYSKCWITKPRSNLRTKQLKKERKKRYKSLLLNVN